MNIQAPYKRYNGGKAGQGTYQQIINFIPAISTYIEPMVGNGGILRNLLLPQTVIINDLDQTVYNAWKKVNLPPGVSVFNQNGMELIRNHCFDDRSTFIYCDPPYIHSTRKGGSKPLYKFEWTDQQHDEFLTMVLTCKCSVMISHPNCAIYREALPGWNTHDFQSMTSAGLMWDRIWMNYPPPVIRQDYRYLGNDYRQRELINKKVKRWESKLDALPPVQQVAILSALIKRYPAAVPLAMQVKDLSMAATNKNSGKLRRSPLKKAV